MQIALDVENGNTSSSIKVNNKKLLRYVAEAQYPRHDGGGECRPAAPRDGAVVAR